MVKQNAIVISVMQYRITNKETGEIENEGCTVRYNYTVDLAPYADERVKGYIPAKAKVPYDDFGKFEVVPALYEVGLMPSVDSSGKTSIVPVEFRFLSGLTVSPKAAPGGKELKLDGIKA